ncbi:2-dehydro-3-deoxygalactonokinase [Mesorhizobium sp. YM1C-6-2]|uniref:2-dehydro-3-deoxygalactonokinase n=1 Tax=Mesorhizobium sp. YM1C-6-2 TaxID=1827501 RepID=UPI000EF1D3D7|nr:2-dehydro-3-deoxygalactonokinase [Mesorhizobium sp. YM1C-6-2]RLP23714.1 2-dehydro-3-deoxygalactonokinase [Mesorhizobium sp. YM1C-6-2]
MTKPAVAAVDWGTSSFRLWLLDAAGAVLAERRSGEGMLTAGAEGFGPILEKHLAAVGAPDSLPVVVCGMAGARQGWIEAPYVTLPAGLDGILAGAVPVPGQGSGQGSDRTRKIRILPGLAQRNANEPDVMRGEETQLAGVLPLFASGRHVICMPGTHSKWVEAEGGVIAGFRTWLTGELFSVLSKQSILRHSLGDNVAPALPDTPAFVAACTDALAQGGDIGPSLFRIRAATLLQDLRPADAAAKLSGLLIGAEIASARQLFDLPAGEVILVASGPLGTLYAAALRLAGCAVLQADADDAVRTGLFEAAKRLGWTGPVSESSLS